MPDSLRDRRGARNFESRESTIDTQSSTLKTSTKRTLSWFDIPDWQRDNEYILSGYRRVQNSWLGCAESLFGYLHNETVNIHSHLVGAVLFIFPVANFQSRYMYQYESSTWLDTIVFAVFLSSAVFCLTASAFYHTFSCHSELVANRCHALDYTGIIILIVGSFYPCIYYGFFCETHFQVLYLAMITLAGAGASYIVLNPEYRKSSHRGARTKVFIALGLCAVGPMSHICITQGFGRLTSDMGFGWIAGSGFLYIGGAVLYANRIPERLGPPGKFDIFFASHQIFHVCVVLAALANYMGILTAFHYRHSASHFC